MTDQTVATDPPVSPVLNASDPPPADPPVLEPSPEPAARTVPLETFTREVTPLRAKVRDLELEREESRRKLSEANELLARLQRNGTDPNVPPSAPTAPPRPAGDAGEIERAAIELNFRRDAQEIISSGLRTYGQQPWQDAVNILESFGLNNAEFVSSVMSIAGRDKAHEVVHSLAQDPSTVAALRSMDRDRRAVEIAMIAGKMTTPKITAAEPPKAPAPPAKTVSRAPAPPPPVEPSASRVKDWRQDDSSEEEFDAGFNETFMKRRMTR